MLPRSHPHVEPMCLLQVLGARTGEEEGSGEQAGSRQQVREGRGLEVKCLSWAIGHTGSVGGLLCDDCLVAWSLCLSVCSEK